MGDAAVPEETNIGTPQDTDGVQENVTNEPDTQQEGQVTVETTDGGHNFYTIKEGKEQEFNTACMKFLDKDEDGNFKKVETQGGRRRRRRRSKKRGGKRRKSRKSKRGGKRRKSRKTRRSRRRRR